MAVTLLLSVYLSINVLIVGMFMGKTSSPFREQLYPTQQTIYPLLHK